MGEVRAGHLTGDATVNEEDWGWQPPEDKERPAETSCPPAGHLPFTHAQRRSPAPARPGSPAGTHLLRPAVPAPPPAHRTALPGRALDPDPAAPTRRSGGRRGACAAGGRRRQALWGL